MLIGVISDTHDHVERMEKAFEIVAERGVGMVCHLGDWVAPDMLDLAEKLAKDIAVPMKSVLGNNDREVFEIIQSGGNRWDMEIGLQKMFFTADDTRIALYHGTDANITKEIIDSDKFNAVFTGHSHQPRIETVRNTLWLNPGTVSGIKPGGRKVNTGELAVYDTLANTAQLIDFEV